MFEYKGKVALITGAVSGIGLEYTKILLLHGCKGVVMVDINESLGQKAVKEMREKFGQGRAHFIKTDVTKKSELQGAFDKAIQTYNQLDIVINNAGIMDEIDFEKTVAVNVVAVMTGSMLAINTYLPKYSSAEGVIVNTASTTGLTYIPLPIYSATKHAVVALGKCLAYGSASKNIRILTICPGATETPLLQQSKMKVDLDDVRKVMPIPEGQPAEHLGKALITVIENGKNGSVWVCDNKPVYEVEITNQIPI